MPWMELRMIVKLVYFWMNFVFQGFEAFFFFFLGIPGTVDILMQNRREANVSSFFARDRMF